MTPYLIALAALVIGVLIGWILANQNSAKSVLATQAETTTFRERLATAEAQLAQREGRITELTETARELSAARAENVGLREACARQETSIRADRASAEEKIALLLEAEKKLREAFQALASEALRANNEEFLKLAKGKLTESQISAQADLEARKKEVATLVNPIQEGLKNLHEHVKALETKRTEAYTQVTTQITELARTQEKLQLETGNLVKALRSPSIRGHWGEIQLKRVVELAGMLDHCDFHEQASVDTEDGRLRPDVVVRLPGGASIVVDAKVPLAGYLESLEAPDDMTREARLLDHARQLRTHVTHLAAKSYWEQFQPSPQFVILFLPGETIYSAALQKDPSLIEGSIRDGVIIATPTTLIALLKAVSYGWQSEAVRENAEEIRKLGDDLYTRIVTFLDHFQKMRKGLTNAVDSYNRAVASLETRVLPQARKFKELQAMTSPEIEAAEPVEILPRTLDVPEVVGSESTPPQTASPMDPT
jgi:DNA recombination protein RmuC